MPGSAVSPHHSYPFSLHSLSSLPQVENMFDVADKDKSGGLSYDEFISFLQNESKAEKEAERVKIRNAVADNMDQHGGQLNVTVTKGAVTKSVQVGVKADSDAVRNHQQ